MESKPGNNNLAELRRRAEQMLKERQSKAYSLSHEATSELVQELHTYQIELELQNEELKIAHQELELSRRKYCDLYDFAPVGYITLSAKGLISEANLTAVEMLAEVRLHLLNQPFSKYIHPDDQDIFYQHRRMLLETHANQSFEVRLINMSGDSFYAQLQSTWDFEVEGQTDQFRVAFTDISQRKKMEAELYLSLAEQKRLSAAVIQSNEMVVITDTQGKIEYVNPAFEKTTGYTLEEVMGKNPKILQSGKHNEEFYHNLWDTIIDGEVWEGRLVNKRKDGTLFIERASITPIRDSSGTIVNYVAVKCDITEHLEIAAQLKQAQKLESVGRLAGGVAHDINNMLSIVLGFSELLLDQLDESDPMSKDMQEIMAAGNRSRDIVRQLLAFARKEIIHPQLIDINNTIDSTLKMLDHLIGEDIQLKWLPGKGVPPINFDTSQLEQIITNLCINAGDAIEDTGQITIETGEISFDEKTCKGYADCQPGKYVMFSVSDNGTGIHEDDLPSIFEPFFTTKDISKGTGLGLAMVYGIVKQNNCIIDVQSALGEGTNFKIFIPTSYVYENGRVQNDSNMSSQTKVANVLVVDDDESIIRLMQKVLGNMGHTLHCANSPFEALSIAEQENQKIDLLITDVIMPEMNGKKLADHIRKLRPEIKILFMSGYPADKIARRGILEDDVNFLRKPFTSISIASAIENVLHS